MSEQPPVTGALSLSEIVSALRASEPGSKARRELLRELGNVQTPATIAVIGEYLDSSDARDGVTAVHALERIGTEPAIATLAEALGTALPLVGAYIGRALVNLGARGELPAIIGYLSGLTEKDAGNKQFVFDALRMKMPHVSEVPVLGQALYDRRIGLRKSAARGLVAIRAPESAAALKVAADELGYWKGRQARKGLRAIQGVA